MMNHATELNLSNVRRRSLLLVGLMVLSVMVGAINVTASNAKHYPVARDPTDLATGDFDREGARDLVFTAGGNGVYRVVVVDGDTGEVDAILDPLGLTDSSRNWRKMVSGQRLWYFESRDASAWLMI